MPDDLATTLAEIRERGYRNGATGAECARLSDAAAVDIPLLLKVAEAVLKLADKPSTGIPPAIIRRAITTALTGQETGDG